MDYTDEYGTLFSDDRKRLKKFTSDSREYSVPYGTEEIAINAFKGNQSLKILHLPVTIKKIESGAFEKSKIEEIHYAGGIEQWLQINWKSYFSQGYKLYFDEDKLVESVIIPENISVIKELAFYYCKSLHSVIFNKNITTIENDAFNKCGLRGILSIPKSCSKIKQYAFFNCTEITKVKIPEATYEIWYGAFSACYGLQSFVVSPGNNYFFTDGTGLYSYLNWGKAGVIDKQQLKLVALASGSKKKYRLHEHTISIVSQACCFDSIPGGELEIPHVVTLVKDALRECRATVKAPVAMRKAVLEQGLPSNKFKTIFVYQDAILSKKTPELLILNPFRVLGVYCNATQREIQSNAARIKRFLEIGKQPSFPTDFNEVLPPLDRTQEMVDMALSQISQPKEKLAHALFWFAKPCCDQHRKAEELLRNGKSGESYKSLANDCGDFRTMTTPYLVLASQNENFDDELMTLVKLGYEFYWNRKEINDGNGNKINFVSSLIEEICGENFHISREECQILFLDQLMTFVNPIHLWACADDTYLSHSVSNHLFSKSIGLNIEHINAQIATAKAVNKNDSTRSLLAARQLKQNTISDIDIIDEYLLTNDVRMTAVHDALADQILQLAINCYNHAEDNRAVAREVYTLMEYAAKVAKGDLLKSRCEDNMIAIKRIVDDLPPAGLEKTDKDLLAVVNRARNSADSILQAETLLKEAEPHLFKIKLAHLTENNKKLAQQILAYFTKVSTVIANVCLNKIIEELNSSDSDNGYDAWDIIMALNQLPLDPEFKKNRYNKNVAVLIQSGFGSFDWEISYDIIDLRTEEEIWDYCQEEDDYSLYIERFPNGQHIKEAKEQQKKIQPVVIKQAEPLATKELETIFANRPPLSDETIRQAEERIAAEKRKQLLIRIAEKEAEKKRNTAAAQKERQQQKGESSKWIIVVALVSLLVFLALLLPIFLSEDNKTQSSDYGYGDAYDTTAVVEEFEDSVAAVEEFAENDYSSEETASKHHALDELSVEDKWQAKYLGNQLTNGAQPYRSLYGKNKQSGTSEIVVTAPTDRDALVMVKNGSDRVIRHAYIRSGMRYTFHISAGYYQVYFICGKDWCPEKEAPNGQMGYFLHSSVSKDSQTYIDDYQSLTYTLQSMANGNFMPQDASSYEAF